MVARNAKAEMKAEVDAPVEGESETPVVDAAVPADNLEGSEPNEDMEGVKAGEDDTIAKRVAAMEEAEKAVPAEPVRDPKADLYKVKFVVPHTFENRVVDKDQVMEVPRDHPFYGMSPKEQEEKYGQVHFVPEQ